MKLMYITADEAVAQLALKAGIDRIFVDMEVLGKADRQGGMDTVQSRHTLEQLKQIKAVMPADKELLVRCNPIHPQIEQELEAILAHHPDYIMLPYFHSADQVRYFINLIAGRCKTMILIETQEAAITHFDEILAVEGVDEYYVGLNDLRISMGGKFLFEPLANGLLDQMCMTLRSKGKPFGFGGISSLRGGLLPGHRVIAEHYRLGSTRAIVSRSFCNTSEIKDLSSIEQIFEQGIQEIRLYEESLKQSKALFFEQNNQEVKEIIASIVNG